MECCTAGESLSLHYYTTGLNLTWPLCWHSWHHPTGMRIYKQFNTPTQWGDFGTWLYIPCMNMTNYILNAALTFCDWTTLDSYVYWALALIFNHGHTRPSTFGRQAISSIHGPDANALGITNCSQKMGCISIIVQVSGYTWKLNRFIFCYIPIPNLKGNHPIACSPNPSKRQTRHLGA